MVSSVEEVLRVQILTHIQIPTCSCTKFTDLWLTHECNCLLMWYGGTTKALAIIAAPTMDRYERMWTTSHCCRSVRNGCLFSRCSYVSVAILQFFLQAFNYLLACSSMAPNLKSLLLKRGLPFFHRQSVGSARQGALGCASPSHASIAAVESSLSPPYPFLPAAAAGPRDMGHRSAPQDAQRLEAEPPHVGDTGTSRPTAGTAVLDHLAEALST